MERDTAFEMAASAIRFGTGITAEIGMDLADDAAEKHPPVPREVETRLHIDGSVMDQ